MIGEVNGFIEEKNGSKYLVFDLGDKNKEILKKYSELWDGIKNEIETINAGKKCEYRKYFMKIKFDTNDNLPLNKPLNLHILTITVRPVFEEEGKFYPQVYLDECLYEIKMQEYNKIDISKEIDVNKTIASEECDICRYWYFKDIGFKYEPHLCNVYHDLIQKAMSFNDVSTVYVRGIADVINFSYMSKDDAVNIMNNSNLINKKGVLYILLLYIKISEKTNYQKNRDLILDRAKDYYKNDKERLRERTREQETNTEIYLKKKKIKRENMEETDITICLKKRNKD